MNTYTLEAVENLIHRYFQDPNIYGEMHTIEEGCLGYGLTVMTGLGLKTAIINEIGVGDSSCTHSIRLYNKTPKKYVDLIEKLENGITELEQLEELENA